MKTIRGETNRHIRNIDKLEMALYNAGVGDFKKCRRQAEHTVIEALVKVIAQLDKAVAESIMGKSLR